MNYEIETETGRCFFLKPLERKEVAAAVSLCNECVGENMYSPEELEAAIGAEERFFYLLTDKEGRPAGYIYFYAVDVDTIARQTKLSREVLAGVCEKGEALVGKIQSVGVKDACRGENLSSRMVGFALKKLEELPLKTVFIVCWKMGQSVPLRKVLAEHGFSYLTTASKIWYDDLDLICPYCGGRCECDAEVYYISVK